MKILINIARLNKYILIILFALLIVAGCKKDDDTPKEKNFTYLIDWQFISKVDKSIVKLMASKETEVANAIANKDLDNVNVYKITYKATNLEGTQTNASGAIIVPASGVMLPLLSYQHGTLFNKEEAPSNYNGLETQGLATILASTGYAVSIPDYLGYGVSEDYPHPYEHAKTLGSSSYEMLMAAKEFFEYHEILLSEKLFLTGYSEGGNATMALHQYIEKNTSIVVTMSAPASGAYNKTAFAKYLMQQDQDLQFLPRFMWVLHTYNQIYGINRPWSYYVNEPDASTLEAITDPLKLGEANINKNPQILFTDKFKEGILNETDTEFLNALADNDNFSWNPVYPITLYYGTADDYVFPLNSETAYDALVNSSANVNIVPIQGADHNTALIPYLIKMFELFESIK